MKTFNKVLWKDGMFMHPHHFQQQDFYVEHLISSYVNILPYASYGLFKLDLDYDALSINKILLKSCIGVLPDGTFFSAPNKDPLPQPIEIPDEFSDDMVYLGVCIDRTCQSNFNDQKFSKTQIRYLADTNTVSDMNLEQKDCVKEIEVAKLNLMLFTKKEDKNSVSYIPIVKIKDALEGITLTEEYTPPSLVVHNSQNLSSYLNKILINLNNYINASLKLLGSDNAIKHMNKTENLLVFQTIFKYTQIFTLMSKDIHLTPYKLFERLIEVLSSICIFTTENEFSKKEITYNHNKLHESFTPLLDILGNTCAKLSKQTALHLDARQQNQFFYINIPKSINLQDANCIIEIELEPQDKPKNTLLHHIKCASEEHIKSVVSARVTGLKTTLMQAVPPYVDFSENALYLNIEKSGTIWQQIIETRTLSVYVGGLITQVKIVQLWIVSV
ncbi:type VI secretion system baseplate subunit TssK [Candidatus Sneabacter namystus]|uniref:Type VI secretion system baseplate subunit TssK n=1 Tax=Candidatus Sneabacter namystus TaxID=2601646 RepID=A0A5C0UI76_9RICK|nr:type VI secretion system baseplate subunit TssK [Candidatus Sneabacter namystus]QEK39905.1 type VI secretion system baseplate subunit TssK [Candidatus Sneabacter namystus]